MKKIFFFLSVLLLASCQSKKTKQIAPSVELILLGTVQGAGSPHIACKKNCCLNLSNKELSRRKVVSLAIADYANQKNFLFEATPNITSQLKALQKLANTNKELPDGIFTTHAHIGHYTGLMYLGKEATNASKVPVYTMPGMFDFLLNNGPWSQLVTNENILLKKIYERDTIILTSKVSVIPYRVPHRDEYSETVGYQIIGPNKKMLFIPDIDKWEKWDRNIVEEIKQVDYAFLDATFYDGQEVNNRDISTIPHPFVQESMKLFESLSKEEKSKIFFIHFNHTNPLLQKNSSAHQTVLSNGFNIAELGTKFPM